MVGSTLVLLVSVVPALVVTVQAASQLVGLLTSDNYYQLTKSDL